MTSRPTCARPPSSERASRPRAAELGHLSIGRAGTPPHDGRGGHILYGDRVLDLEPWQVDLRQPWADGDAWFKPMPGRASLRLRARHRLQGIEAVNADLAGRTINVAGVLAAFGARIA